MPRTPHCVADHKPFGKWSTVVGAGGTDRKIFIAESRQEYGLLADMPREHVAVGEIINRDALRQVRTAYV
jgi:hypothetical protein